MKRRYLQMDVFADRPGLGNPLGVVLDSEGLDSRTMQQLAAWLNLSETTFVLPSGSAEADYGLRIFTPRQELPFAGHPSVGTAHALLSIGAVQPRGGALAQECAAGVLPLRVEKVDGVCHVHVRAPRASLLAADVTALAGCLPGVRLGSLGAALVNNGPIWGCVELADEAAVRSLQPDLDAISTWSTASAAVGLAVFARCRDQPYAIVVRAFVPADGISEDPVTGSANAAIAAWMHSASALPAPCFRSSQGRELGRDGVVEIQVDAQGQVWIGGQTQTVITGEIEW